MKKRLILLRTIAFAASLSLLGVPGMTLHGKDKTPSKAHNKKGAAPTAASLVDDMKTSVIYIVKNAKDISPKSKQAVPFWSSLKTIIEGIDLMDAGIQKKSPEMLKGLDIAGQGITELAATWGMIRGAHPKSTVGRGVVSLSTAYDLYVNHFGPSVASYKKGGGKKGKLTDAEIALIEKSGTQLEALLGKLEKVAAKAKPKSYQERMILDLVNLVEQLAAVEGDGRLAYAKYQYQWNRLQNALAAYSNIIKAYYPDYYVVWQVLDSDSSAMNTLFYADAWSYYETWNYYEVSIENYESYYEEISITETITETEETQYEETLESYEEETATEEDAEDEAELEEEIEVDEEEGDSLFEEVEDSDCDEDGDGESDAEDTDDDNDGVSDEEDGDDDGDGLEDEEEDEEACDEEDEEEEEEDEEDDGIAECCEDCCC
ncbi:hypothetical protein [Prosthecobacter sp.]|uniref:hypothetical protein n=1 Tax=Prosthecobacter sp. TaxID=1965333 RepID=UPI002AB8B5FC|nr:hypothetical protein [Prosthecobacter sp.]MDZ4406331.1 hypothetical protein [Prosthecobacter sp.]